jgi:hypothetical protein
MNLRVWLAANTLLYPEGGGHLWAYLNWALGLRAAGCDVVWLEGVDRDLSVREIHRHADLLRDRLAEFGLGDRMALAANHRGTLPAEATTGFLDATAARGADLLINMSYEHYPELDDRFRRRAVIDIDPGLLQLWIFHRDLDLPPHDAYFTIGEHIGAAESAVPTCGIAWQHTFPAVALGAWPVVPAAADGRYTTVSHWYDAHWVDAGDECHDNDKRGAFLKYLELPQRIVQPLELALCLRADEQLNLDTDEAEDAKALTDHGWRVRHAHEIATTPGDYRRYIQRSLGEFSCAKPAYTRLQNAWMSDRTVCFLASGKPAVVEHTGPSDYLPDCEGLFRFQSLDEAAGCFETLAADYPRQCRHARALTEKLFDARKVAGHLVERAMS